MKKTLLYIGVCLAVALTATAQEDKDHQFKVGKNLEVFTDIYKHLDLMYVDTLDADKVVGTGIQSMLKSLDPYTEYFPEEKQRDFKQFMTGKYAGIGALIRYNQQLKRVIIDEPYENMPAAEVGLKKGDIILSIDDEDVREKDNSYVSSHLRGDAGTRFVLKILRPSTNKKMTFKLTRRAIQLPFLPFYGVKDSIGYLNFNQFTDGSAKEIRRAVIDMKRQGMKGLVFDLRNNGGGSEQEASQIVNLFVPQDLTVVSNKGKVKRSNHDYKTTVEPLDTVMPLVVLVNGNSASASEITCGALQDFKRAVVLGTRTFGKGVVQTTMDMPYNGTLKMTIAKYYLPSGRCIHGTGVTPDIEVKADSLPNIAFYLVGARDSNEVLLNYELDYIAKHPTIASPSEFELSDADYEEFKQRVLASGFVYDRESEKCLKNLVELAKFEGYYEDVKEDLQALEKKLSHNVEKDLDYNKRILKQIIENGLVTAYYYERGAVEHSLCSDKQYQEAVKLLLSPEDYQKAIRKE